MHDTTRPAIDPEFRALIPSLTKEEYAQLEMNLDSDGCRDALVLWNGVLLDGHNRKEICERLSIDYQTTEIALPDREAAKSWIITNQFGRRNLQPFQRAELALRLEPLIAARAKENQRAGGGAVRQTSDNPVDTKIELAKLSGLSHDTIHKAKVISEKAPEEAKERLRRGESTINHEYQQVIASDKRARVAEEIKAAAPAGKYHVLVVDPPWPMEKIERDVAPNQAGFEYPTLSLEDIEAFQFEDGRPMADLAGDHAHLFLWTTHKFLPAAFKILNAWNFKYICSMVWHKAGGFQPYGLPQYNCEFVLYGRRGQAGFIETSDFMCCFNGKRQEHSRKPSEFYSLLRRVTLEPRIDVFSREFHEGFDQFGNQTGNFNEQPLRQG